ncbi:peptidoglycan editing factor PgeF [Arcobacter arenosus]|uniref:Purine nucleoside phosphorylase n=1 Tax=Arcobacter arenosus TaxID=2576037 RepID=A0A5R8XYG1_9BACT|nr:peptidoglycan editing factor PgeF [Arcobacter arenosus]TLP36266.1 peptidoglycan editing factor PgeF [Arcobacter arenosus]
MDKIFFTFTNIDDGNLAFHVPDTKDNVDKNRKKLLKKYNLENKKLISMNQVHGNNIKIVDSSSPNIIDNCDGIITNDKDVVLMVMVADCIPIIFIDRKKGVIAAVHAGRNSTFLKISELTAKKMVNEFNCNYTDIEVHMGPSIQKCCYEVSDEMVTIVEKSFGKGFVNGRFIDLQGINLSLLKSLNISNITISNTCTKCSNEPYFSYRVDNKCGRFAGIVTK